MGNRRDHIEGAEILRGMSDRRRAETDQPELLENVYLDSEGTWRTSGGYEQITPASFTREVIGLHWFSLHQGGKQFLLLEYALPGSKPTALVGYLDFTTDLVVALESGRTLVEGPRAGSTFFDSGDWCYILNGYDAPKRWNGREYVEVGFSSRPPPPTVSLAHYDLADLGFDSQVAEDLVMPYQRGVGVDGDPADATVGRFLYGYAIQWVNDRGMYSPRSEIQWIQGENEAYTSSPRGKRSINVLLPEAPANVRGVRVLRTTNLWGGAASDAAPMYEVASISTGGRVAFVDDRPDYELAIAYDEFDVGIWPVRARYAGIFKGVLFVDEGNMLRYSAPGFIEQMPSQNTLLVGNSGSGPIMGMKASRNSLIVWKRRGIYLVRGNPVDGFGVDTLTEDIGAASPRAIVEVPGKGTLFLSDDGPYLLVGALESPGTPTAPKFVGHEIAGLWRKNVNTKALLAARGTRHLKDREIWFQVPQDGQDRPGLGLIYHFETGGWSTRTGFTASCFAEGRDHRGLLFFGSWDSATSGAEGLFTYTRGSGQNGTAVTSTIDSPWIRTALTRALPYTVEIFGLNTGRDVTVKWRLDRDRVWLGPSDTTTELVDREKDRARWGTAVWGTAYWEPVVPIVMNQNVHNDTGREFQWQIVGEKIAVFGYAARYSVPSDRAQRAQNV